MGLSNLFRPKPTLTDQDLRRSLRMLTFEGISSLSFVSITTSGFLAAFALALGANNLQIGILAAIPFITQPLQIPLILVVERLKRRKAMATLTWLGAQLLWFPIALIPVFIEVPNGVAVSVLLGIMALRGILSAACSVAWNGWLRDLVPRQILGRFFSQRLSWAAFGAAGFSLVAAFFVDFWRDQVLEQNAVFGYTIVLFLGTLTLGLASPFFMSRISEPLMQSQSGPQPSLARLLITPLRDSNFRQLMNFLFFWGFALNLAVPFFAVYMLQRLEIPLSGVIALSVLSQLFNVMFLRLWGPLADRFGNKTILSICASLYILVILGWAFTSMPDRYFLTIPLLVALHIFSGAAAAGVTLTVGTLGLKLAPQGQAVSYLAGASLATNVGAGLGPLVGGLFADFFSVRSLTVDFSWTDPARALLFPAVHLTGYDFLFATTFVLGLLTLNTLTTIREEGEVSREVVLKELLAQSQQVTRAVSSVPGLRFVAQFPYSYLRHIPGVDVALGITAYQLAAATRAAIFGADHGLTAAANVASRVRDVVTGIVEQAEDLSTFGVEVTRQVTRGAMHAADDLAEGVGMLAKESVKGIVRALSHTSIDTENVFWGVGYGAIQGSQEVGGDPVEAAVQAIEGAREVARELGLSEDEVARHVAKGSLEAAKAIGRDEAERVKGALSERGLDP